MKDIKEPLVHMSELINVNINNSSMTILKIGFRVCQALPSFKHQALSFRNPTVRNKGSSRVAHTDTNPMKTKVGKDRVQKLELCQNGHCVEVTIAGAGDNGIMK